MTDEEDPSCPLCLESIEKRTTVRLNCCSGQVIHVECYVKSLPRCPFCRADQPSGMIPVHVTITDWPRVTKSICVSVLASACVTIFVIMNGQCV